MYDRNKLFPVIAGFVFLIVMCLTEQILKPVYFIKSLIKFSMILIILVTASVISGKPMKEMIHFRKMKPAKELYLIMGVVFCMILLMVFLLKDQLDLSMIRENLMQKEKLTKENCLFVFAYIALINSFLEEALFRGFLRHETGMLFSAVLFSFYHIGIIDSWLNPIMLILCMILLLVAGLFLQKICDHYDSMKASWLVHGCANLAINTIGAFLIFEII